MLFCRPLCVLAFLWYPARQPPAHSNLFHFSASGCGRATVLLNPWSRIWDFMPTVYCTIRASISLLIHLNVVQQPPSDPSFAESADASLPFLRPHEPCLFSIPHSLFKTISLSPVDAESPQKNTATIATVLVEVPSLRVSNSLDNINMTRET